MVEYNPSAHHLAPSLPPPVLDATPMAGTHSVFAQPHDPRPPSSFDAGVVPGAHFPRSGSNLLTSNFTQYPVASTLSLNPSQPPISSAVPTTPAAPSFTAMTNVSEQQAADFRRTRFDIAPFPQAHTNPLAARRPPYPPSHPIVSSSAQTLDMQTPTSHDDIASSRPHYPSHPIASSSSQTLELQPPTSHHTYTPPVSQLPRTPTPTVPTRSAGNEGRRRPRYKKNKTPCGNCQKAKQRCVPQNPNNPAGICERCADGVLGDCRAPTQG